MKFVSEFSIGDSCPLAGVALVYPHRGFRVIVLTEEYSYRPGGKGLIIKRLLIDARSNC